MNLFDLFRRNSGALPIADRGEIIARYLQLRMVGRNLNNKLVKRLSKDVLYEGARKLGILQQDTLVFDTEDESSVLMDYCLYDVRRNGRNTFEQYLADSPPDAQSDEMTCLRAMQRAIYSLFMVESVEPGLGVTAWDLVSNESWLVVDMGFGSTAQPGLVFASRLLPHEGFSMTSGAALPVGVLPADDRAAVMQKLLAAAAPDDGGHFDPARLIRACLSRGSSSHVRYEDATGPAIGQPRSSHGSRSAVVGRNALCPCGSGKKFKQCCLKRR